MDSKEITALTAKDLLGSHWSELLKSGSETKSTSFLAMFAATPDQKLSRSFWLAALQQFSRLSDEQLESKDQKPTKTQLLIHKIATQNALLSQNVDVNAIEGIGVLLAASLYPAQKKYLIEQLQQLHFSVSVVNGSPVFSEANQKAIAAIFAEVFKRQQAEENQKVYAASVNEAVAALVEHKVDLKDAEHTYPSESFRKDMWQALFSDQNNVTAVGTVSEPLLTTLISYANQQNWNESAKLNLLGAIFSGVHQSDFWNSYQTAIRSLANSTTEATRNSAVIGMDSVGVANALLFLDDNSFTSIFNRVKSLELDRQLEIFRRFFAQGTVSVFDAQRLQTIAAHIKNLIIQNQDTNPYPIFSMLNHIVVASIREQIPGVLAAAEVDHAIRGINEQYGKQYETGLSFVDAARIADRLTQIESRYSSALHEYSSLQQRLDVIRNFAEQEKKRAETDFKAIEEKLTQLEAMRKTFRDQQVSLDRRLQAVDQITGSNSLREIGELFRKLGVGKRNDGAEFSPRLAGFVRRYEELAKDLPQHTDKDVLLKTTQVACRRELVNVSANLDRATKEIEAQVRLGTDTSYESIQQSKKTWSDTLATLKIQFAEQKEVVASLPESARNEFTQLLAAITERISQFESKLASCDNDWRTSHDAKQSQEQKEQSLGTLLAGLEEYKKERAADESEYYGIGLFQSKSQSRTCKLRAIDILIEAVTNANARGIIIKDVSDIFKLHDGKYLYTRQAKDNVHNLEEALTTKGKATGKKHLSDQLDSVVAYFSKLTPPVKKQKKSHHLVEPRDPRSAAA